MAILAMNPPILRYPVPNDNGVMMPDLPATDTDWAERLSPEQYDILRCSATEPAFTGAYWDTKDPGSYKCAGCGTELFRSDDKYDSGTGWPSFVAPADVASVTTKPDTSYGRVRTEVLCATCGGHLGHVFDDGPGADGLRYCINSGALDFDPTSE
jgi:peptide-methionine (R)-S-oxide reductase